jgi:hypothetical protein
LATLKTQKQIEIEKEEERIKRERKRQERKVELLNFEEILFWKLEQSKSKDILNFDTKRKIVNEIVYENDSENYTEDYLFFHLLKKYDTIANKIIRKREKAKQQKEKIKKQNAYISEEKLAELDSHFTTKMEHKKMGNMSGYLLSLFFK